MSESIETHDSWEPLEVEKGGVRKGALHCQSFHQHFESC